MSKEITLNETEIEERENLREVQNELEKAIVEIDRLAVSQFEEIMEQKRYLAESKTDMDHVEKVSVRQSIEQMAMIGEHSVAKKKRLNKLKKSPYFGRIDFSMTEKNDSELHYIGIHNFVDSKNGKNIIYDWRAPVSSMFYDFELGNAFYEAPGGKTEGQIHLKRQYRIKNGKLDYMLESSLNIHDDVLQKELRQTSNEKMKNIVATIQRDQNAIIRNDHSQTLVIQGAAGSGKTSIALHRIAFLLYKFRDTISSEDILIISPNKVFGDYISNVLPELGEEKIKETSMETIANELLNYQIKFESFFEQVSRLLGKKEKEYIERISFKSSNDFLKKLEEYIRHLRENNLTAVDIVNARYTVPAEFIESRFNAFMRMPFDKRITEVTSAIVEYVNANNQYEIKGHKRNEVRKELKKMFRTINIKVLYKDFYEWLGKPEMFKLASGSKYEYSDVFPLIYMKMQFERLKGFEKVKHLVIDEMQDYTPIQYRVLSKLFICKKTILGDSNQSVNPFSSSSAESIGAVIPNSDCMFMNKSYRSTIEITKFAQLIRKDESLEPIERHGEKPAVLTFENEEEELRHIKNEIDHFKETNFNSLGIICKTQKQAGSLYKKLKESDTAISLLDEQSSSFSNGIIVASAYMSKGLEFDHVIVPFCNEENYRENIDRQMLYVACTRAMHKLMLTFTGSNSNFLDAHIKQEIN